MPHSQIGVMLALLPSLDITRASSVLLLLWSRFRQFPTIPSLIFALCILPTWPYESPWRHGATLLFSSWRTNMNSVRPLVTITILVVVGAYLYVKINEGPGRPVGTSGVWQNEAADGVPPLDTGAEAPIAGNGAAPPWPTGQVSATATSAHAVSEPDAAIPPAVASSDAAPNADLTATTLSTVPAIPALPDVSASTNTTSPVTTAAAPAQIDLPANIPTARYPDQPATPPAPSHAAAADATGGAPPFNENRLEPTTQSAASADVPTGGESMNSASTAIDSPELNPLRQTSPADSGADRYPSVYGQNSTGPEGNAPVVPAFAASWPEIQSALDQGKLALAHQLLSKWHDDPSLMPAEAERVETLLGQLAGTVVYSTEHQLEPPRVVKPGETLETIAKEYNVSWQLLAKINGIPAADQLQPGQQLKVVRGPFSAVVDLDRKQLTLMLDGRYAGKFTATESSILPAGEGEWIVAGQLPDPRAVVLTRADVTASTPQIERVFLGPASLERLGAVPFISLSEADTSDVSDILSVGSRVVIRR